MPTAFIKNLRDPAKREHDATGILKVKLACDEDEDYDVKMEMDRELCRFFPKNVSFLPEAA